MIKAAAQEPAVERIFVNAAIKKALCRDAKGDRAWLHKVRPMYGHDYHFHIRIRCPPRQRAMRDPDRSGRQRRLLRRRSRLLVQRSVLHPKPPKEPPKPKPPMTLAQLPAACKQVLLAPDAKPDCAGRAGLARRPGML